MELLSLQLNQTQWLFAFSARVRLPLCGILWRPNRTSGRPRGDLFNVVGGRFVPSITRPLVRDTVLTKCSEPQPDPRADRYNNDGAQHGAQNDTQGPRPGFRCSGCKIMIHGPIVYLIRERDHYKTGCCLHRSSGRWTQPCLDDPSPKQGKR